jgi:hypothetical protein
MVNVAIAGQFAETLIGRGFLSVAEAQSTLSNIAEEMRDDGDADGGHATKKIWGADETKR